MSLKPLSVLNLTCVGFNSDHGSNRGDRKIVPRLSGLSISLILDLRARGLFGGHIFRSS